MKLNIAINKQSQFINFSLIHKIVDFFFVLCPVVRFATTFLLSMVKIETFRSAGLFNATN